MTDEALLSWIDKGQLVATLLVAIGVAGEFVLQFAARPISRRIEFVRETEIARLNSEAARLNKVAEEERLARVEIEDRVAWRRLTAEQQSELGMRLAYFSGQPATLWYNAGDKEADTFASEIGSALHSAHWLVFSPASVLKLAGGGVAFGVHPPLETGVVVVSTADVAARSAADALVQELLALGFDAIRSSKFEERKVPIVIIGVEVRPEGPQGKAKLRKQQK